MIEISHKNFKVLKHHNFENQYLTSYSRICRISFYSIFLSPFLTFSINLLKLKKIIWKLFKKWKKNVMKESLYLIRIGIHQTSVWCYEIYNTQKGIAERIIANLRCMKRFDHSGRRMRDNRNRCIDTKQTNKRSARSATVLSTSLTWDSFK